MNAFKNQKGIALIVALVVAFIILVLGSMALYITTQGTKMSGSFKQYRSAVDAADGAFNETKKILGDIKYNANAVIHILPDSDIKKNCLNYKLTKPTINWSDEALGSHSCRGNTVAKAVSTNIEDIISFYDIKYTLGNYNVYLKITNSATGNTADITNNNLTSGGVTGKKTGADVIHPPTIPFLYRIDIVSQSKLNANDRAVISVLYGY